MAMTGLRGEERKGLIIAIGLHLLVLALLLVQAARPDTPLPKPERMTVNLTEDVGLEATAPDPVAESRAAEAPTLGETIEAASEPLPRPVEQPPLRVVEPPAPSIAPAPRAQPQPRTPPRAQPRPQPSAQPRTPAARTAARPAAERPAARTGGASRIGNDFLAGAGTSATSSETRTPASAIGASAKASLFSAIRRKVAPQWQPPSGPEVEQIVTRIRFRLNSDGSLSGRPSVVSQSGVNDTNRAQAGRHGEQAVRAVQLAAPFDLPAEYYEAWKTVTVDFDWKLSQ